MLSKRKRAAAHTDGACSGNPGPGGFGVVLQYGASRNELSGGFRIAANNRMGLLAVIKGLETLKRPCRRLSVRRFQIHRGRGEQGLGAAVARERLAASKSDNLSVDEGYEKTMGTAKTSSKPRRVAASSRKAYCGGGRRR